MSEDTLGEVFLWAGGVSLVAFVLSIVILPLIVMRLPADYFIRSALPLRSLPAHRFVLRLLKNMFGILFLAAGFIMLFIPGQGILSMLLGLSLMDFPRKREWQTRLVRVPRVHRSLNWLRARTRREPFILPPQT